jgi:hypothetical protein
MSFSDKDPQRRRERTLLTGPARETKNPKPAVGNSREFSISHLGVERTSLGPEPGFDLVLAKDVMERQFRGASMCYGVVLSQPNLVKPPLRAAIFGSSERSRAAVLPSPLVSIVIPVYNGEAFVADAIESVLAQEAAAFELIVVDDGSTDATPAILARYGGAIAVRRQPNRGHGAARNAALPHLRGQLALFLDADDLLPAGYLDRFAAAAHEAPEIEVFHCGWRVVSFDGAPLFSEEEPRQIDTDPFHELMYRGSPAIDSILVRRSALARVGGFDPALQVQAELDFCLRLAASGARFRGVPGNVATVRRRPDSVSGRGYYQLGPVAVAVLKRHLRGHARCPACEPAEAALRSVQRGALLMEAQQLASRIGLTGRPARWIGSFLAVARRPRLSTVALDHAARRLGLDSVVAALKKKVFGRF